MPGALSGRVVAVTGAGGFIGARLVERLIFEAATVIRVVRTAAAPIKQNSRARVIDHFGDVGDRTTWQEVADADVIFHLAAQTSVAASERNPEHDFHANVMPMRHLLDACGHRQRAPIVIFAGTVTEAGVPARWPVNEDAPDDPITTYDRHKLMAENDLKAAASSGAVRGATLRLANVYGPGAHGRHADRDVFNRMIGAAISGQPLTVYGDGTNLRDYVFVDDVIDAFVLAAHHADRVNAGHFVIGSGSGISVRDAFALIAARVERATGRRVGVTTIDPPAALSAIEQRNFVADHTRFSAATGWQPHVTLPEGIDRTIEALACV